MIDLEDSSTWDRTEDGLMICPGCGAVAYRVSNSTMQGIIHLPECNLPQWDFDDED